MWKIMRRLRILEVMMYLTVIRHAKAKKPSPHTPDMERPLGKRGRTDSAQTSRQLNARGIRPDLVLTSPAQRARQSAEIICNALDIDTGAIEVIPDLYSAGPEDVLRIVCEVAGTAESVFVVGHNPTVTNLTNLLCGKSIDNVSPGGFAHIEMTGDTWQEAISADGTLVLFAEPERRGSK